MEKGHADLCGAHEGGLKNIWACNFLIFAQLKVEEGACVGSNNYLCVRSNDKNDTRSKREKKTITR